MHELHRGTAVVTGGAGAIGFALAMHFGALGMNVVLADIEQDPLDAAVAALTDAGVAGLGVVCDVSDLASVTNLADEAEDRFGALHVLCNNAGVVARHDAWGPIEDWEWVLGVDLWGVIHGVHTFVPRMLDHGEQGHVVNTASAAGIVTFAEIPSYSVAKQGVVALSEALAHQLDDQPIGVSVLCPGAVRSGIGTSERNRPDRPTSAIEPVRDHPWAPEVLEPNDIAAQVVEAIRHDRFWVLPHEHYVDQHHQRADTMRTGERPAPAHTPR